MVPSIIFIIPYRDRIQHKTFFEIYMKHLMEDYDENSYEIYFSHQCDKRKFNRGAMKNIGFLAMKEKYKNDYKNITFIFNDVDTLPYKKNLLNYQTKKGIIKHFYGYPFSLGGIFSIKGEDFESINGFPNYWAWGMEDNVIQDRAIKKNIKIDRSHFYKIGDPNILQFFDGLKRLISKEQALRMRNDHVYSNKDGINAISNLKTEITNEYINAKQFKTLYEDNEDTYNIYDIRNGAYVDFTPRIRPKRNFNMNLS